MDNRKVYVARNAWLCLTCHESIPKCQCVTDESLLSEFAFWIERNFQDETGSHQVLFGTLTFGGYNPGRQRARKALQSFRKLMDARTCKALYAEEFGKELGRLHYHFLVQSPRESLGEASLAINRYWSYGHTQYSEVKSSEKSSRYVAKYLAKDYGEGPYFEMKEDHLLKCKRQLKLGLHTRI